jgi:hypothetical protein
MLVIMALTNFTRTVNGRKMMISFSSGQSEASERPAPIELAAVNLFTSRCRIASTCVLFALRPQSDCQWRDAVRILQRQEEAPHVVLALPPA